MRGIHDPMSLTPEQSTRLFAEEVRGKRIARKWSQRIVAEHIDLSQPSMTRLERGQRPILLVEAYRLSMLLDINIQQFAPEVIRLCESCGDNPPTGFTCNACGQSGR